MTSAYSTYNDAALLSLLSTGDDRAFTEIYNRYWEKILYLAALKCRSVPVAEEIVQDIFLDIWDRRFALNITGELEAYLSVCVKYKVINAQAKMKRALDYEKFAAKELASRQNSSEEWLSFHELQVRLAKLVQKLPERCRITYQLSREQGLSQKEVARTLKITEKAVEANLSRALKLLRTSLKHLLFKLFSLF